MRIPRLYTPQALASGSLIDLDEASSRHLVSVLRMSAGQQVILFNGLGGEYSGELSNVRKNTASVSVSKFIDSDRESPLKVHLAIGVSRGDRMDWIVQKATELGVCSITPLFTERTEVKLNAERLNKKNRHWQQVAISACEQCQRTLVPLVSPAIALTQWVAVDNDSLKLVLHHRAENRLTALNKDSNLVSLLVGPEGGLSDSEIDLSLNYGFKALALGPRVLRTETAPLAALSILQSLWGDMG
ncbi:MAG: 16S rRNA methyltransferase [SAR92 bacterium BACL26 MAG-121220-bin70]|jgi:16S rRNA (uracil1498-N3)-methyltransferase|uniref:Ribosomal RNA small subunit methyltransferase E n=1 Tax=SAR92 bacterium BACL26 MAG-121220-bin70 TaxID=1655626 RepID=A0A0R2UDA4_9GAMM|nr:MAG: 16S rRNA methyltransferase [SAR92 bacterium BACL26 MAG-121220-bin70]